MTSYEYENGLVKSCFSTLLISVAEQAVLFLIFWGIGHLLGAANAIEAFLNVLPFGSLAMLLLGVILFLFDPCGEKLGIAVGVHLMALGLGWLLTLPALCFCIEMLALGRGIPLLFIVLFGGMLLAIWIVYMRTIYKPIRGAEEVWEPNYSYDYDNV